MNDDELATLVIGGLILVVIFVLLMISTIADTVSFFFTSLGAPPAVAGQVGAFVFAALSLFILMVVIKAATS